MNQRLESRARDPDVVGATEQGGVSLSYEVFGEGDLTVLLMPAWSIVRSRFWKEQIGFLARHYRVVSFDGRGSGRSGRPRGASAYTDAEYAADAVAVMDATGTKKAVLVALSRGVPWALRVAAEHPDRVLGLFAMAPACRFAGDGQDADAEWWSQRTDDTDGWAKYNRNYWLDGGYEDFVRFFFAEMFPESHSTKQIEDCVGWALEVEPATLVDTTAGAYGLDGAEALPIEPCCQQIRCPVMIVHGDDDRIVPPDVGRRLADLTNASMVMLSGVGHGPPSRHPVRINLMIRDFVDRLRRPATRAPGWVAAPSRRARALYLSSPIGLGHARRDVAIVNELRTFHPELEVDWLAQHPVTTVLEAANERIHPASAGLSSESEHIEHEAGEHDLHAFQAVRRMDEILVSNFMVFHDVVERENYDLVIGDEAWDVDYFLHENPELKRFAFAWITDFVGWLPMPDGGDHERALTADYNAEMIEQRRRFSRVRDLSLFVGNPEDVVSETFGPGLPLISQWVRENFEFPGYVTGIPADEIDDRDALRHSLGYGAGERICIVTVGGSGVGEPLLHRVLEAAPLVRRRLPDLHFEVVAGPRIDPASLPSSEGVTLRGHVPNLYRHLAACDVGVVQGGLTTTMELTASQRPFIYVPLRHHFEQNIHVRHRLDRHGAGRCLDYREAMDPEAFAEAIVDETGRQTRYRPVETDGAAAAARMLADLV